MLSQAIYACINTRKFKGLESREITTLPAIKKVIYMAHHFNNCRKQTASSSQDSFAYNESLQHPTIAVLLSKILLFFFFRPLSTVFSCSIVIKLSSDGPTCFRKALHLIFPKLSSQNMGGFGYTTILIPSFPGLS